MKLPAVFERYRRDIDAELDQVLSGRESPLYDMMRYHLGWMDEKGNIKEGPTGKALRPTLCLLASEAVGGDYRQALPAAAAIELVHNFSLIHDDIQDDDRERRHRPTVWSIWGKAQAINAGTAMKGLSSLALRRLEERGITGSGQLRAHYLIEESCLELIEGQYLDISYESRFDIGVNEYLDMIDKKTAALIACSMEVGASLGNASAQTIAAFREIGHNMGLGFQVQDDILGIWGDERQTGKPRGGDIRRKKKSFPVVYALENAPEQTRAALIGAYQNGNMTDDDLGRILEALEAANARTSAEEMAQRYLDRALAAIERLDTSPDARRDMEELLRFLVQRNF